MTDRPADPPRFSQRARAASDLGPAGELPPWDAARVQRRLDDLAGFATEAAHLVAKTRVAYLDDSPDGMILRSAGRMVLIKVATVAEKLPREFKDAHPGIQWSSINRMRNLVAHHYDKVDDHFIWNALVAEIPKLATDLGLSVRTTPGH